ncbi:class I SAM-dependent methyltransferase [Blastococcus jejuensis]|uniref:Class I SAM-dependent methyltransferase n=1 Tax=Blastococcus jejuensis TaxID=351224 RepID=A0ABP6P1D6_9ACTN
MAKPGTAVEHPFFARLWVRMAPSIERQGAGEHRQRLLHGISGRVVEVGAGTGSNFGHYPAGVTEVVAVEPEPRLRALAAEAARDAAVPVTVVDGVADRLPADDGSFDAAVVTLVLCSVPDQAAALAELRRVVRPGGRLYFWEHVRAERRGLARVQRLLDATVWPRVGGGCHTARDTMAAIADAGFVVERVETFAFPDTRLPMPASPHVLGVAVRS